MNMIVENSARNNYGLYAVGAGRAEREHRTGIKRQSYGARPCPAPAAAIVANGLRYAWPFALTPLHADGVTDMKADEFNRRYAVGSHFTMKLGNYLIMKQRIASLPQEKAKHSRQVLDTYLEGIADGDVAVDSIKQYQQKKGGDYQPYSCAPAALPFDSKLVEKMIDAFNTAHPDADKTVNVAILYVSQMAKTYPCK